MKNKLITLCIVVLFFTGCSNIQKVDERGWPVKLTICYSPADNFTDYNKYRRMIADYLEEELDIDEVNIMTTSDYAAAIEAMKSKKLDIGYIGELAYLLAQEKAGAEAIARAGRKDSSDRLTWSEMLVHPSSGINSIEDIKERASELVLAFTDPASTSGHLYPRLFLESIGLDPESSFKEVLFTNSHTASVFSIQTRNVDIAFTHRLAADRLIHKNKISHNDVKKIWESEPYLNPPIFVRGDLPGDLKKALQKAYVDLAEERPDVWNAYKEGVYSFYPKELRDKIVYVETHDSCYNKLRGIIKNNKQFNFYDD